MKTPRLTDFDPAAEATALQSPLDDMPAIQQPSQTSHEAASPATVDPAFSEVSTLADSRAESASNLPPGRVHDPTQEAYARPYGGTPGVPYARPPVRVGKRTITRYAFEFYQDQIEHLQGFALEEKRRGGAGSMSAMVREAIDAYIARRRRLED